MATSPILRKMVLMANQPDKIWKWGGEPQSPPLQTVVDTEQVRNLQDSETYNIHVSDTKITYGTFVFHIILEKDNLSGGAPPAEKASCKVSSINMCGCRKEAPAPLPKVTKSQKVS